MYQNKLFDAKATNQCQNNLKPCSILDSIENHDNEKAMLCEAMLCEVMQGETVLGIFQNNSYSFHCE